MLDCARKGCTEEMVKSYVDIGANFLTIHLSDNEGVANFSGDEIANILDYAARKGVSIIPEIDMPAHMGGFFGQARELYGDDFVKSISVNEEEVPGELNITEPTAIRFADSLLARYMEMFRPSEEHASGNAPAFSIGADEFWTNYGERTIRFINRMDSILTENGFVMRIYNDLILKEYIDILNKDIQVVYWSHDGAAADPKVREERIARRASLPDLQAAGFDIIETNSYYLYFVPSANNTNQHDLDYTVNDIANWNLSRWDANYEGGLENYSHIVGAEIAVWREESAGIDDGIVLNQASRMFNAMRESVRTSLPDSSTTGVFKIISAGQPRNDQEKQTRPRFNKKSSSIEIILKEKRFDAKGQSRYFFRERVVDILF